MPSETVGPLLWHVAWFGGACVLILACAVWTAQRRERHAATEFAVFLLVTLGWTAAVLLRIVGPLPVARRLHAVEQFFQTLTPIVWFYFAAVYTGHREWLHRRVVSVPLAAVIVGMVALESVPLISTSTFGEATVIRQPFVFVVWTDTVVANVVEFLALGFATVGSGLILYSLVTANYARPWQVGLVFVSTAGAVLVELFDSPLPSSVPGVDYSALAVTGVAVSYLVGLYRYNLFGYTPVDMSDVIDSITAPVLVLNPERRVVDFNASARAVFEPIMRGDDARDALPDAVLNAMPLESATEHETELTLSIDGQERTYRLYATPLDSFGDVQGLAITFRDVTTRRRQQETLDLLRQILTRSLRHNVRNEIDIIKANTRALVDNTEPRQRERARTALAAADDLVAISDKTRVLKDVVQDRQRVATFDVSSLLSDLVAEYRGSFPETEFVLECPSECRVRTNPTIEQALSNLIENGAEHNTRDAPEVRITVTQHPTEVEIQVSDNGPGIPGNELNALTKGEEEVLEHGSGLGLWIVNIVIRQTDGSVQYDTDSTGTTVTVRLPRDDA